jgi:hypothetical protein
MLSCILMRFARFLLGPSWLKSCGLFLAFFFPSHFLNATEGSLASFAFKAPAWPDNQNKAETQAARSAEDQKPKALSRFRYHSISA